MLNSEAKLAANVFDDAKIARAPSRDGYGKGLVRAGEQDERVVVLCADLTESTRSHWFQEKFPKRFIEIGVAEQNLAALASGLANYGKIPFISSYAAFSPGRNNEQIRTTISLNQLSVKIAGAHAGISVGPDGATHQALEDIALMRVQPHMTVIAPCDAIEAEKATLAAAFHEGPVYIRLGREASPVITTQESPFAIGKAMPLFEYENPQVTILSTGILAHETLMAAHQLAQQGIGSSVIHCATIKPLDMGTILESVRKTQAVVTVEEHQIACGFGSAITELLAQHYPVPVEYIGIKDRFGESGTADELLHHFKLDRIAIIEAVKQVIIRKR